MEDDLSNFFQEIEQVTAETAGVENHQYDIYADNAEHSNFNRNVSGNSEVKFIILFSNF